MLIEQNIVSYVDYFVYIWILSYNNSFKTIIKLQELTDKMYNQGLSKGI